MDSDYEYDDLFSDWDDWDDWDDWCDYDWQVEETEYYYSFGDDDYEWLDPDTWTSGHGSRSLHDNKMVDKRYKNKHANHRYYCQDCDRPKKKNPAKECTYGTCYYGNLAKRRNRKVYAVNECRRAMKDE